MLIGGRVTGIFRKNPTETPDAKAPLLSFFFSLKVFLTPILMSVCFQGLFLFFLQNGYKDLDKQTKSKITITNPRAMRISGNVVLVNGSITVECAFSCWYWALAFVRLCSMENSSLPVTTGGLLAEVTVCVSCCVWPQLASGVSGP